MELIHANRSVYTKISFNLKKLPYRKMNCARDNLMTNNQGIGTPSSNTG